MDEASKRRWQSWRDQLNELIGRVDMRATGDCFDVRLSFSAKGSVLFSKTRAAPHWISTSKTAAETNRNESVRVVIPHSGRVTIRQNGRETELQRGTFSLYDALRPVEIGSMHSMNYTIVTLPRAILKRQRFGFEDDAATRFDTNLPAARVFLEAARSIEENAADLGAAGLAAYEAPLVDLLTTAMTAARGEQPNSALPTLHRIMGKIQTRLRDPDLSLDEVALSESLSKRSIHRLFQLVGMTPWQWVIECRLQGVASDLKDARNAHRMVADISFAWGFTDQSHFGRAFKSRFGISPNAFRKQHRE